MGRMILVIGGARSGKSTFAEKLGAERPSVVFFATAEPGDAEMTERIKRHKAKRPNEWRTVEMTTRLPKAVAAQVGDADLTIVDCLTVYISNLLEAGMGGEEILNDAEALAVACRGLQGMSVIVSNEVGLGIVPDNELARAYRDILGRYNQVIAAAADEVYLMIAGMAVKIK